MDLLTREEKEKILYEFNQTKTEYPKDKAIVELFEEQAEKNPNKIAIVAGGEELTYTQLNCKANQLAKKISVTGVKPNEFVGIMANRRMSTLIGILGILKAGAAYLPLDPKNPLERQNYILKDSKCQVVLVESRATEGISNDAVELISIFGDDSSIVLEGNLEHVNISSKDLAYLMYTSGTTGEPKGVMIEQQSVIRLVKNTNYLNFSDVKILQTGSLTFDASTFEIWGTLLNGGTLYMVDEDVLMDANLLAETIAQYQVNTMFVTTALYNQLISLNDKIFDGLEQLLFGGEAASEEHVRKLWQRNKKIYFANVYGPTESTTFATYYTIAGEELVEKIPIGKPISNTTVYILDGKSLCGIGMSGELCIGGDGLSRGYLNSPALTDEKYIENPYIEGEKIYRTGDLARWTEEGNIEYLGRIDDQVKIRGFRIELGEIESKLREIEIIKDAVVIAREKDGNKYLCGYVVGDETIEVSKIKEQLGITLPEYMIPTHIMVLEKFPLTRNGKISKKELPVPELTATQKYIAPTNEVEHDIAKAFEEMLDIEQVGIDDNFFELGGDSIKAIRIVSQLRKQGYKLSVKNIMKQVIVRKIAESIVKKGVIEENFGEVTGSVALTPIQKNFFQGNFSVPGHYNQSFVLESKEKIDADFLKQALAAVSSHHDMLRAVYDGTNQKVLPINESKLYDLTSFDFTDKANWEDVLERIDEESEKIQGSINLSTGPLLKSGLFHTQNGDYIVLCIHHLVVDGVSWRIIIEDLAQGYHAAKQAKKIKLPSKTESFQTWSKGLETYRESFTLKREIPYWQEIESKAEKSRFKKNTDETKMGLDELVVDLTVENTGRLLQQVGKIYHAEINDLLLTALFRSINKVTGQQVMTVMLEGHGREELDQPMAIDRTVGWFTSVFPVAVEGVGKTLKEDLRNVKEMVRRIPNHGIGYGILDKLGETVLKGVTPEIVFNYLGEFGREDVIEGFSICNINHGSDVSEHNKIHTDISIYGLITNKKLRFSFIYNKQYYSSAFMEELQMYFELQLNEIINYQVNDGDINYTASDLGELGWSDSEFTEIYQEFNEKGYEVERIYPLTGLQEGMVYHKLENEEGGSYVVQNVCKILNKPDEQALKTSLQLLSEKHEILRTSIVYKTVGEPRQVILKGRALEYVSIDLSNEVDIEERYKEVRSNDIKRGFDLEDDSLFRLTMLKLDESTYYMIMSFHHSILDGWCMSILMNDLFGFYDKICDGKSYKEISDTIEGNIKNVIKFEDYVRFIQNKDRASGQAYWNDLLEGYEERIGIRPEGEIDEADDEVDSVRIVLSEEESEKLELISKKYEVTLNTVVEAAWGILLQKYNNTDDVVFGKVVSGRNVDMKGIEDIVGLFINTVAIRVQSKGKKFSELLFDLQQQSIGGYQYDYCSLSEVKSSAIRGGGLFDTLMAFENYYVQEAGTESKLKLEWKENREQTNYPLTFTAYLQDGLHLDIKYDTCQYGKAELQRIINRLKELLLCVADNPEIAIDKIELLTVAEKEEILENFNNTHTEYPQHQTMIELFEEQVAKMPDEIAVVANNEEVTYRRLNHRANQLGKRLRRAGIKPDDFVAIVAERKISTIVGILGILKSGGAYLPLDPNYPIERTNYILKDSKCKVVLSENLENQYDVEDSVEMIDLLDTDLYQEEVTSNLEKVNQSSSDLAYLIYTSGTTGIPKGVMIEQKSVNRLVKNTNYAHLKDIRILQTGSLTFDASVFEIWAPLLNGGKLYIVDKEVLMDANLLETTMKDYEINTMFVTTALFNQLISMNDQIFDSLNQLFFGGEAASEEHIRKLWERNKRLRFSNMYGPSECTTYATYYPITGEKLRVKTPIGKPISNTTAYIFNGKTLNGISMIGELCLGGDGLSRGYLNSDDLTKEKYFENPYRAGERLYRTGDLARWSRDGNIEFLGRIDEQVKIRGFRIELQEIESKLRTIELIKDAAVIARELNGSKYLCAYVVSSEPINIDYIKEQLGITLPDYMIPTYITELKELPLNKNQKVDKKALPDPQATALANHVVPRTDAEMCVKKVFEEVLGVSQVGIDDSFFDLGGDSIKAMRVVSKLREYGYKLKVRKLMQEKTIRKIAQSLTNVEILDIDYKEVQGIVELTPIQREFFRYNFKKPDYFNQSLMLESKDKIDSDLLGQALASLAEHHDMLRAVYQGAKQEILSVKESKLYEMTGFDFSEIESQEELYRLIDERSNEIQGSICLATGPLLKVGVFQTHDRAYIMLCIHHLVVDGVSWRILIEDLLRGYTTLKKGVKIILPPKTTSFLKWSKALHAYRESDALKQEIKYWKKTDDLIQLGNLKANATTAEHEVGESKFVLSAEYTNSLLHKVNRAYETEINELLIASLCRAVYKLTEQRTVSLQMEGHGREDLDKPITIDRTVGWFTSIYPVVVSDIGKTIEEDIITTKNTLRKIPNYGIGYGVLKEIGEQVIKGIEPTITFNYLGEFGQESAAEEFLISDIPHGAETSEENQWNIGISVVSQIANQEFKTSIFYDKGIYNEGFIDSFKSNMEEQLIAVIDDCIQTREKDSNNTATNDINNQFNITQFIWSEYGADSILKTVKIKDLEYLVLFVENLDESMRGQICNNIIKQAALEKVPHYILDMKQLKLVLPAMEKEMFIEMCHDLITSKRLCNVKSEMDRFIQNFKTAVIDRYEVSSMQMFYFKTLWKTNTIVQGEITIEGNYTKDQLINAYKQIVQEQAIFRSSLQIEQNNYLVAEHEFSPSWYIPYIDLTYADIASWNEIYNLLDRMYQGDYILETTDNLSIPLIVKESEKHHVVYYSIHHGLWNKTSEFIFIERFQDILKYNSDKTKIKQTYKEFIGEIKDCIKNSDRVDIARTIDIKEYIRYANEYEQHNEKNIIEKSMTLLLKMGPNVIKLYQEDPWKLIVYIFKIIAKENQLITENDQKIPMFILNEERRYMKGDYTNTMGEFLDKVPILVDNQQDILIDDISTHITANQKLKMDHHLNYFELLCEEQKDFYSTSSKILTINFQGEYELPFEEVQTFLNLDEYVYTSESFVNRYANNLIVFSPIFTRLKDRITERTGNILEEIIQNKLDLLEQRIDSKQGDKENTTNQIDKADLTNQDADFLNDQILDPTIIDDIKHCPQSQYEDNDLLITGVTGFLGAYTLAQQLETSQKRHIYCLIRGKETDRVKETLMKYKLWKNEYESKFTVLCGNLAEKKLGLASSTYDDLLKRISQILHIAADTNHIKTYNQLRDTNVEGTVELIKFSSSIRKKEFFYVSTMSVLDALGKSNEDTELTNIELIDLGYVQTKYVSEKLLLQAREAGMKVDIIRVGRVAPSTVTGIWRDTDGYNMIFESFYELNMVPNIKNTSLFFTPVDYMSECIGKIISTKMSSNGLIFHLHNAYIPIGLEDCYKALKCIKPEISLVTHHEWYDSLMNSDMPDLQMCQYIADLYLPLEIENYTKDELNPPISVEKTIETFKKHGIPVLTELNQDYLEKIFVWVSKNIADKRR